jgi:hypothetical protein
MARHPETEPTATMLEAIRLIVEEGMRINKVCEAVGISYHCYNDWTHGTVYPPALKAAKEAHQEAIWNRLRAAGQMAAETLIEVCTNPDEKGSVRIMAANSILEKGGYIKADQTAAAAQPYQTRDELVQALSAIPADVLAEALSKVGKDG